MLAAHYSTALNALTPYTGTFGLEEAAHLLRRATMGATYAQIQDAVANGLDATVTQLLTPLPLPPPPINYRDTDDPNLPLGATWVDVPYNPNGGGRGDRRDSFKAWAMFLMVEEGLSIREKMTLFWHNHFVVDMIKAKDAKFRYPYITLLRENALGDFKQLVKDMTINIAMLRYLDGNSNVASSPNENYAREVLELFTIGKGPTIAPGDYSNYTEDDVLALAKVFTGWTDVGYHSTTLDVPYSEFLANKHDTSDKTLSYHFGNTVISDAGADEYKNAIDIIFQQDEVAYFICRKLYRWFVNYDTDAVEATVIAPMAQCLIDNNYVIQPVMEALLKSEHFYEATIRGAIIKNPIEYAVGVLRIFEPPLPSDTYQKYAVFDSYNGFMGTLGMELYHAPNVAGWPALYQSPQFTELWVNAVTIKPRMEYMAEMAHKNGSKFNGYRFIIDVLAFVATLNNPSDPNSLIDEISLLLFPKPIVQEQKDFLKNILIPGLPDFEWTVEYSDYLADPADVDKAEAVETRLRALLTAMFGMPEYHLS